ncbi:Putative beta-barrel porin-2, OmpL-like. bbp2 [Muriicola jejuensis]|uniref:Outer membrane beta-barrel protein n=1 Tax=Muriicola jejuensis TaxID=504488 RepID=A0A6P0UCB9_9FLAO|nr:outer membrane beta-barrel protein [Muriicola jejuensis]NER10687.1 outer membrane beta-barrel protein [Muriicola jejuensis]SMP16974.1 Putative beta-barrel porin-2, OmpL-like. bbp2 [Muriicola jejuensis]
MKTIIYTNFGKNLLYSAILLIGVLGFAQEEEESTSPFSLSGSIDTYFRTTFNDAGLATTATPTSFANQTGFALGMANLIGAYEKGSTGVVVDLVFGPRGTEATFENDVLNGIINQAYAYWNVSESTTLTIGRFNTWVGYEVISPVANFNYSVSYLFSNGPFSHIGVKADFALSEDISLMVAVTNPWDTNDISGSGEYALGTQLGVYGQYLNLYYDSGSNGGLGFEIDYTGGVDLTEDFFLGINAAYNQNSETDSGFYGAALYPQFKTSDDFALGLRGEYFAFTQDGFDDVPVIGLTLTGSFTKENLIIKPEIRLDTFGNDNEPFSDSDGAPTNNLSSFLIAAIYSF